MTITKSPTPPKPLPKPRWYLEQRAKGIKMPVSPERVKVIQNTLPEPQNMLVGTVQSSDVEQRQMPEKTVVLSSATTTPSTTVDESSPTISNNEEEERFLAKENAVIDHLLAETEHQLEEVARHVRGLQTKDLQLLDFEEKIKEIIEKIELASRKMDDLELEQDLTLRKELVNLQVSSLESQVSSLFNDPKMTPILKKDLNTAWISLKDRKDKMKSTIHETELKLKTFRKEMETLKRWLSSAKVKLVRASHDDKVAKQFVMEVKNRKSDIDHLNLLASQLQHRNALSGQEMPLNFINADWQEILERMPKDTGIFETLFFVFFVTLF